MCVYIYIYIYSVVTQIGHVYPHVARKRRIERLVASCSRRETTSTALLSLFTNTSCGPQVIDIRAIYLI